MLGTKIQSMREQLNISYTKPDPKRLDVYKENLLNSDNAKDYLYKRGLIDKTIEYFHLGYDPVKDAIVIPIFKKEELINLRYRYINPEEGKPKYTQEKGGEVWVYHDQGINNGIQNKWILIVEGEFDAMLAYQTGFKNVISPASGKDSYLQWVERVDSIPSIAIAYDNDDAGKGSALKLAERLGIEKCKEVVYPFGSKDFNEYYLNSKSDDKKVEFLKIVKESSFFYKHTFKGVGDIFKTMFDTPTPTLKLDMIPFVEAEKDFVIMLSGTSNAGKTAYALNVAKELARKKIPTLVLPFERGVESVGKRYIQVYFDKTQHEFLNMNISTQRDMMLEELADQPIYFALPDKNDVVETIRKAKRIFGIEYVIVDHLDYLVTGRGENYNRSVAETMKEYKTLAQQEGIIFLIVHHIGKPPSGASKSRRPRMEDLKGASDIYQVAEAVVMLYREDEHAEQIESIVVKNKGRHGFKKFSFNLGSGAMKPLTDDVEGKPEDSWSAEFNKPPTGVDW